MRLFLGLLAVLLILLLAGWLAPELADDPGYVLIRYRGWSVEASLLVFLVLLFLVYGAVRIAMRVVGMPRRASRWLREQRTLNAQQALQRGLLEMSEGEWKQAERLLTDAAKRGAAAPAYLTAARAAQALGDDERRDRYLEMAADSRRGGAAVAITRAELHMARGDWLTAKDILKRLRRRNPRQAHILRLLAECYRRLGRWKSLNAMLPRLKRTGAVTEEEHRRLQSDALSGMLTASSSARALEWLIKRAGKKALRDARVLKAYTRRALALDAGTRAEKRLRDFLDHQWDPEVVELYGLLPAHNPRDRLNTAENWLESHPQDPVLLLTLGRLCMQAQLWGKARDYLESSIGFSPSPGAYVALAELAEQNGENTLALRCYRNALMLERGEPAEPLPPSAGSPLLTGDSEGAGQNFTEHRTTRGVPVPDKA